MSPYRRSLPAGAGDAAALRRKNRRLQAENRRLRESRRRYRQMFANARVVLWEEDFSAVIKGLEDLKALGVRDFEAFFEEHPEKAYELMRSIKILDVNPAGEELFRAPSREYLIGSLEKIFVPESFPFVKSELAAVARGEHYFEGETVGRTFDGQTVHLLVTMDIPRSGKRYRHVMVSMMDISPRIQRERERDRLLHRYREARLSSEILREVTLALTSSLDQSAILDTILSQAARLVPFDSGNIRLLEDGRLRTTRWFGYEERGAEEFIAAFNEHVDNLNMAREVIENATPRIINDTAEEPNFVIFPETSYIRSLILMPISTARKFYGLLSVESSSPDMYGPEDTRKLKPLADATAVALENAALYEELRSELEERKRVEQRLELSLSQKETLLREIHHRVKNNLSMVISLINLQSSQIADETARELLEHIGNKIHSIILIHEKLYRSHDLQHIALREYVQELLSILRDTIVEEGTVQVDNDIAEDLAVDIERAIPLALIITELFTNSYKYGNRGGCRFSVRVRREGDTAELRAQDNGPGFPPGFSLDQGDTLGLLLVQSLASQLGGTARIGDPEKAEILVRFPLTSDDERSASPSPHTPSQRP